ncbi:MAG: response regulator [Vicinamibacterales bacterium]
MRHHFSLISTGGARHAALIVEPALSDIVHCVAALDGEGFRVTVAASYREARALMTTQPPDVLITELRLGDYNGLQLVLRARSLKPTLAPVVTSRVSDAVLQAEAVAMGATYVLKPVTAPDLLAAVLRTLHRHPARAEPIEPPFERRSAERRTVEGPASPSQAGGYERRHGERRRAKRVHTSVRPAVAPLVSWNGRAR